ncbi:MAG: hypothetical protein ABI382_09635 [Nakamurella sp.]
MTTAADKNSGTAKAPSTTPSDAAGTANTDEPPSIEPSPLELKYRRRLRILPKAYRAVREDEMVATFLDSARDADPDDFDLKLKFGSPGWVEARSVVALALQLRWADPHAPERYQVRVGALRLATIACLAAFALFALINLPAQVAFELGWPPVRYDGPVGTPISTGPAPWYVYVLPWAFVLWIPTPLLALAKSRRLRLGAVVLVALALLTTILNAYPNFTSPLRLGTIAEVLLEAAILLGTVTIALSRAAPVVRWRGRWVIGISLGAVVLNAALVFAISANPEPPGADQPPEWWTYPFSIFTSDEIAMWCWAVAVAGAILWLRRWAVHTTTLLALTWLAIAAAAMRASYLVDYFPIFSTISPQSADALMVSYQVGMLIQLGLVVAVAAIAAAFTARRIHQLPAVAYGAASAADRANSQ